MKANSKRARAAKQTEVIKAICDRYMDGYLEHCDLQILVENYVTKATCLWTKGLPNLKTNNLTKPDNAKMYGRFPSGKAKTWEDQVTKDRASVRSKTFPGIARAMAEQWG